MFGWERWITEAPCGLEVTVHGGGHRSSQGVYGVNRCERNGVLFSFGMIGESPSKARIRRTALALFRRCGLDGFSMRAIAREVGVSPTAIYRYYPSRDALLGEIADHGFDLIGERVDRPFASDDPEERICEIFDRYLQFAHDEPRIYDLMLRIDHPTKRVFPQDYLAGKSRTANVLIAEIARCIELGRWSRTPIVETVLSIWAHGHGHATLYEAGRIAGDHAEFRAMARRSLIRLVDGLKN
jgi:AcrR family transcriptional regulator